jgi:AcrR family transcriptional regulator
MPGNDLTIARGISAMSSAAETRIHELARATVGGERREAVLDAAIAVIVARGFDNTRYADIAEASGVAVSTLQYYFGSLEALLIETCLRASQRDLDAVTANLAERSDPWAKLAYLVDVFMTSDTPGLGWQAQIEYWRAAFTRPHLREELIRDQDRWRALFRDTIEEGMAAGIFITTRGPELIAMQLNCLLDGTVFPAFVHNPAFDGDAFRAACLEDIATMLGYTGPG